MTTLPLSDLIAPPTADQHLASRLGMASLAGFPASSWQSGSVPLTLFDLFARSDVDEGKVIAQIASGGFLDFANGPWLDLLLGQFYGLQRKPAVYSRLTLTLADEGNQGPLTLTEAGQVWVSIGGVEFRNVGLGTVPLGGVLEGVVFEAAVPGLSGNQPDGTAVTLVTSLTGFAAARYALPGASWLLQQGVDEESDDAARLRARARWGELGYGANEAAYLFWLLTASPEVTRAAVGAPPGDGSLPLYVAGANGAISGVALAQVQAYVWARRPQCVRPEVQQAAVVPVPLLGQVKVRAPNLVAAQAAGLAALQRLAAALPLGPTIYRAPLEAALLGANPGVLNAALSNVPEQALAPNAIPVFDVSGLTWVTP